MKTLKLSAMAMAIVFSVGAIGSFGIAAAPKAAKPKTPNAPKTEYTVVRVGSGLDVRVIESSELQGLKMSIEQEDKSTKQAYDMAKQAQDGAKKTTGKSKSKGKDGSNPSKFDKGRPDLAQLDGRLSLDLTQKPVTRKVMTLKAGFKNEQDANAWKDKYIADPKIPRKLPPDPQAIIRECVRSEVSSFATRGVVAMPQGTIKKIVSDRGFGFISAASGDIFFHHTVVVDNKFDELKEGQSVTYDVATGPDDRGRDKGPRAVSVAPA